jgi:hypothetical protein
MVIALLLIPVNVIPVGRVLIAVLPFAVAVVLTVLVLLLIPVSVILVGGVLTAVLRFCATKFWALACVFLPGTTIACHMP